MAVGHTGHRGTTVTGGTLGKLCRNGGYRNARQAGNRLARGDACGEVGIERITAERLGGCGWRDIKGNASVIVVNNSNKMENVREIRRKRH